MPISEILERILSRLEYHVASIDLATALFGLRNPLLFDLGAIEIAKSFEALDQNRRQPSTDLGFHIECGSLKLFRCNRHDRTIVSVS